MTTIAPIVIITLALVFYSIGVWSERFSGRLKVWHLLCFWLGFICDTWGTGLMFDTAGRIVYTVHSLTGFLAISLMFIHAIWATAVLLKKDEKLIVNFHKFSLVVWVIWLIPYLSPMVLKIAGSA